ncbi:MAG TPA: STAS/SEC14 domain-containing protein [Croceibacterium sp.]|nr:STAS/SEC14 domain-containing protein [Croceibacterium sp.]
MLEQLDSVDNVLAVKVSHKVTGQDLETIMDRLEAIMAAHDKVHVFAESHAIDGIELASLPSYMARALPLLGKLDRFGRVAVVADQGWVRAGSRLESAMLPNIKYRVYAPDERQEALAWVTGVGGS